MLLAYTTFNQGCAANLYHSSSFFAVLFMVASTSILYHFRCKEFAFCLELVVVRNLQDITEYLPINLDT